LWHDHSDGESIEQLEDVDAADFTALDAMVARAGGQVLRRGGLLIEADAATFRGLGGGWYADAEALWFDDTRMPVADTESIHVRDAYAIAELEDVAALRSLGAGYAADSRRVLFAGYTVAGPDPHTARSVGGGYLVDARGAWYFELATESRKLPDFVASGGPLAGADPRTLSRDRGYALDDRTVYWGCVRVDGADAATFRALDTRHGAHASAVYFESQPIADADPTTFRVLGGDYQARAHALADINGIQDAYATDGRELYLQGRPVHDRSARYLSAEQQALLRALVVPDVQVLDRWWATDGRVVLRLWDASVDPGIDAPTFEVLGHGYAQDRTRLYGPRHALHDVDRGRFRVLADGYAGDGNRSWHDGHPIAGSHGPLHALGGGWARDDAGIYAAGTFVDADRATFVVLDGAGADIDTEPTADDDALYWGSRLAAARDRDRIWWSPYEPPIPAADAVVIAHRYALTSTAVYHAGRPVDADLATFTEIGDGYARDAFRGFFQGRPTR
jgi:DKNYY family protein